MASRLFNHVLNSIMLYNSNIKVISAFTYFTNN